MLQSTLKSLGRDTMIYGIAGSLQRLAPFIIVPILTRSMTQEEYGNYDTAVVTAMMLGGFAVVGQDNAVARFINDDKNTDRRRIVATSGFIIQLLAAVLFISVVLLSGKGIGDLLFSGRPTLINLWTLSLWIVPGFSLFLFAQNILKWILKSKWYLALSTTFTIVNITLAVILVVVFHLGAKGAVTVQIGTYGIMALLGWLSVRSYLDFRLTRQWWDTSVNMLLYGLPFILVMVISNALPVIDRLFIVRFDTAANLGVYALGTKVAMLMMVIVNTFQIAFGPISMAMWDDQDAPATFRSLVRIVLLGLGFFALLLSSNGEVLLTWLGGEAYTKAIYLLPLLCGSMVLSGLLSFTKMGIYKSKRSRLNLAVIFTGLVSSLVSNALLVPMIGILGAAVSMVLVQVIMNICAHKLSVRYYDPLIQIGDIIKAFSLLVMGMAGIYIGILYKNIMICEFMLFIVPFSYLILGWFWLLKLEERIQLAGAFMKVAVWVKKSIP